MCIPLWLYWVVPLAVYGSNALAWGLATHLYFSPVLIWVVPLLGTRVLLTRADELNLVTARLQRAYYTADGHGSLLNFR
jgi:hypothetical protein